MFLGTLQELTMTSASATDRLSVLTPRYEVTESKTLGNKIKQILK